MSADMNMNKKNLAVLFGGQSGEHDVSLRSAFSIMSVVDPDHYNTIPVGITPDGLWLAGGNPLKTLQEKNYPGDCCMATIVTNPAAPGLLLWRENEAGEKQLVDFIKIDIVFPVLHGPYGEDGTVQGLLEMAGIPYVGSGVLASALGMDKVAMKNSFIRHGLPVGQFVYFKQNEWAKSRDVPIQIIENKIGYPCFVKPANLGSSVGISKIYRRADLGKGLDEAFLYDEKVIVEAHIPGREIECSVLGDLEAASSVLGEIIPSNDFYDYNAKYIDDRSVLIVPVKLPEEVEKETRRLAVAAFQVIGCCGMARVDFFVEGERVVINELNTIPGFTSISMYPKLWEASGMAYKKLVKRLIELAEERFVRRRALLNLPPV